MTNDPREKKANRLIHATRPYLLQHAYNPVDWYEWGSEALNKASKENKPILVSIGYSACHWCHVMERESFEKEDIAQIMNAHFVPQSPTTTFLWWYLLSAPELGSVAPANQSGLSAKAKRT